ncbi:site-specific integrase [Shewanella sp. SG41-3]|uniref:tyrosine-type recombinase/integrase n=1 Tax=Shewanella sp. SG41-3 TaxID=2760977 RepID=UPI0016002E43|nr:site-specific integrase [Shewanella sp. SG41-3]MBB1475854.1 site-specific integrase [Shewanella sp. SG41-3]
MATNKLSDRGLRVLLSTSLDKSKSYSDGGGLSVRVTASKSNSDDDNHLQWQFRYRLGGREAQQLTLVLGKYPELTLATARKEREQCRQWLAEGRDPKNERNLGRVESLKPLTVKSALLLWIENYASKNRKNSAKHLQQFNRWIFIKIGHLPISQIAKHHWIECFEARAAKYPVAAGYVLRNAQQALKYVKKRGYEVSGDIFELDFESIGARAQAKRSRRLLSDSSFQELVDLLKWLKQGEMPPYYNDLVQFLIIFGCRTQEIRLSKIDEWDFERMIWTVPSENNKNVLKDKKNGLSGEILRPIPERLKPWLLGLASKSANEYILGDVKADTAVSGWGSDICEKLGHEKKWTLHDLRRTVATGMNDLGIAPHIVELILGHTIQGVAGIYNRSQRIPEKLQALELWLDRLELLQSDTTNVVLLEKARA